jgi:hypothetical protein
MILCQLIEQPQVISKTEDFSMKFKNSNKTLLIFNMLKTCKSVN